MGIETVLGLGLGAAGLLQNHEQGRRQQNAQGDANALGWEGLNWQKDMFRQFKQPGLEALMRLAQNYDPVGESRAATDHASTVAQEAIGRALRGFNVRQAAGGGTPGNSSLEGAQRSATMRPIAQMLAGIVADAAGNQTARKAQMWQAALGQAPAGDVAQSYFQMANQLAQSAARMPGGDFGPSSQLLSQALGGFFNRPGGAGGSGDQATNADVNFATNQDLWFPGGEAPSQNPLARPNSRNPFDLVTN